jgi:thioredoxin-related protein
LENTTLREPSVIRELSKNFISIKIDTESPQTLTWEGKLTTMQDFSRELGVSGLPTLVFLNHKQEIVGSYPSYADRELMLNLLAYISSGSREKQESFQDFLLRKAK